MSTGLHHIYTFQTKIVCEVGGKNGGRGIRKRPAYIQPGVA